ncbi:MAG: amidohydrolase family protein [Chloroflexi bacterium]|nr:amidohydrolase family protein [Chloroflexota bacterium]
MDFPIIDSHVHIWDTSQLDYPWLATQPALNRPFLLKDFDAARGPIEVEQFVFVQAECRPEQALDEVAWVSMLAKEDPRIGGIVAYAPLETGEAVRDQLERLAAFPLVRGIRRIVFEEDDVAFCTSQPFIAGVRALAEFGLSFDLALSSSQLVAAAELADACPDVRFVLDHIGKPDVKNRERAPWMLGLPALAECPNVWCKLSGVTTQADHDLWTPDELRPYLNFAVENFGINRVMFGGDWPVSTLAVSYPIWVGVLHYVLEECSNDELRAVFHDNTAEFYRLRPPSLATA